MIPTWAIVRFLIVTFFLAEERQRSHLYGASRPRFRARDKIIFHWSGNAVLALNYGRWTGGKSPLCHVFETLCIFLTGIFEADERDDFLTTRLLKHFPLCAFLSSRDIVWTEFSIADERGER